MAMLKKRTAVSLFLITFVLLGIIGLGMNQSGKVYAASTPAVGIVDYLYLINHHPETAKANEALQAEQDRAKKEFADKSGVLNDKGKQDLQIQLEQRIEQKRQELLKPIADQINAVIKTVADAKGLSVVVFKNSVAYGGIDITTEVSNKLNGK